MTLDVIDEGLQGYSSSVPFHHQKAQFPWQQHLSKDDTFINTLGDSPAEVIDELRYNLVKEFKRKRRPKAQTVSTQTEIFRTPEKQIKPYSRNSLSQTSAPVTQKRNTDTQTERDSNESDRDEFKSSSFRTADSADVKQADIVSKLPTLNSAILLPVDEALSPGDSASDLNDSFVTAFSSPVSSSPLRGLLRGSPDQDISIYFEGAQLSRFVCYCFEF